MQKKLEPGMVCVITGTATDVYENVGREVTLVALRNPGDNCSDGYPYSSTSDTSAWEVQAENLVINRVFGRLNSSREFTTKCIASFTLTLPRYLTPIKGDEELFEREQANEHFLNKLDLLELTGRPYQPTGD